MAKGIEQISEELRLAANVFAQAVGALSEIEGMKAENIERERNGLALAYDDAAFADVRRRYDIEKPWLTLDLGVSNAEHETRH